MSRLARVFSRSSSAVGSEPPTIHVWGKSTVSSLAVHAQLSLVAIAAAEGIVKLVAKDFEVVLARDLIISQLWFIAEYLVGLVAGSLAIWNLKDTSTHRSVALPFDVWCAEPSLNAEVLMLGTSSGDIHSVDLVNAELTSFRIAFVEHGKTRESSGITCLAMNETSKEILVGFEDGFISRYSLAKRCQKKAIAGEHVVASLRWLQHKGDWHFLVCYADGTLDEYETSKKRRLAVAEGTELLGIDSQYIWCAAKEGIYTLGREDWKRTDVWLSTLADAVFVSERKAFGACSSEESLEPFASQSMVLVLTEDQRLMVHCKSAGWEFEWGSMPWMTPSTVTFVDETKSNWIDQMFALRCYHFETFLLERPTLQSLNLKSWNSEVGGAFGLYLCGYEDGTCRIWLVSQSNLLLLHTVSLPLHPMNVPHRPLYKPSITAARLNVYDGVDACPSFTSTPDWGVGLTKIAYRMAEKPCLVLGAKDGSIGLFMWNNEVEPMSMAEQAELQVLSMLENRPEEVKPPKLTTGFVLVLRCSRPGAITDLALTPHTVVAVDAHATLCITDFNGSCLYSEDIMNPGAPMDPLRIPSISAEAVVVLALKSVSGGKFGRSKTVDCSPYIDEGPAVYEIALSDGSRRQIIRQDSFEVNHTENASRHGPCILFTELEGTPLLVRARRASFGFNYVTFDENVSAAAVLTMDEGDVLATWYRSQCHFYCLPDLTKTNEFVDASHLHAIRRGNATLCKGRALVCSASPFGPTVQFSLGKATHSLDEAALKTPHVCLKRMLYPKSETRKSTQSIESQGSFFESLFRRTSNFSLREELVPDKIRGQMDANKHQIGLNVEKATILAAKAENLAEDGADFLKAAKNLNRKQKSGWF